MGEEERKEENHVCKSISLITTHTYARALAVLSLNPQVLNLNCGFCHFFPNVVEMWP